MREGVGVKITRKNSKLPALINALTSRQVAKALFAPTSKAAAYVAENKLTGQVLNVQSGNLRRSLLPSVKTKGYKAWFGTAMHYGAVHEFGKGKMPRRPWLAPGTQEYVNSGKFMELFKKKLFAELHL